ncbi:MAG TPA: glycoside hydrolase family 3 N-terminal domain-containing protein [Candidatus Megaira endosymbiont of Nemacystus decipiens]|nr:glycoside hydrolase family 3 N-terminal domain-containing protein [Candidatus Megaera endosymbiont of Nemacystus decipiens]
MMLKPVIFSISGTKLTLEEIEFFTNNPCVGFILFQRNIESNQQLKSLTKSLRELQPNNEIKIFVDQEGGRVARIKPPIASRLYPPAKELGDIYFEDPLLSKSRVRDNFSHLMMELKSLGIDSPCAPNCDIMHEGSNETVIGDRSFGSSVDQVVELSKVAIQAIQQQEGIAWIKHIPGHGRATKDSHFDLPIVTTKLAELDKTDFEVFRQLSKENCWGMTGHVVFTALDDKQVATCSSKVISYVRNNIGFKGILVTDDICMAALGGGIGIEYCLLNKILKTRDYKDIDKKLQENLNINLEKDSEALVIKTIQSRLEHLKPCFIDSMSNAAKLALEAGCDIVLHCSGDIEEMRAIVKMLDKYFKNNVQRWRYNNGSL